jgi:hypothetical protein
MCTAHFHFDEFWNQALRIDKETRGTAGKVLSHMNNMKGSQRAESSNPNNRESVSAGENLCVREIFAKVPTGPSYSRDRSNRPIINSLQQLQ